MLLRWLKLVVAALCVAAFSAFLLVKYLSDDDMSYVWNRISRAGLRRDVGRKTP